MGETHRADARSFLDNRGTTSALTPNGLNPSTILERAVINRIINNTYFYKEQCFAINEADIINRCVEHVTFIGGTFGDAQKASPFLCLAFKLLQLAPSDEVLELYLGYGGEKFKYLRCLAAFYVRLTRKAESVFRLLEPLLSDGRKVRRRGRVGYSLTFVDSFVDELLTKERVCGTTLWKMPRREVLEDLEVLEVRVSPLGDVEDLLDDDEVQEVEGGRGDSPGEEFGDEEGVVDEVEKGGQSGGEVDKGDERSDGEEGEMMDIDAEGQNGTNGIEKED